MRAERSSDIVATKTALANASEFAGAAFLLNNQASSRTRLNSGMATGRRPDF